MFALGAGMRVLLRYGWCLSPRKGVTVTRDVSESNSGDAAASGSGKIGEVAVDRSSDNGYGGCVCLAIAHGGSKSELGELMCVSEVVGVCAARGIEDTEGYHDSVAASLGTLEPSDPPVSVVVYVDEATGEFESVRCESFEYRAGTIGMNGKIMIMMSM